MVYNNYSWIIKSQNFIYNKGSHDKILHIDKKDRKQAYKNGLMEKFMIH